MTDRISPWYVQWVVGIGAWVTALVLMALGGAIVTALLDFHDEWLLAVVGGVYLAIGIWIIRRPDHGTFAHQLGIALSAAGAGLVAGGLAAEVETLWVGVVVSILLLAGVVSVTASRTLQFLVAALACGFYVFALADDQVPYLLDLAAIATPIGFYLLLRPPRPGLMPTAIALLCVFPLVATFIVDDWHWFREVELGGTFARILHILLFLGLVYLHWRDSDARHGQILAFAVVATVVCLLMPPGGSAAMLILMLAYVIGSTPLALFGTVLQAQFIIRYYYSLQMSLLDKSLLLMAVGVLLLAAWWFADRADKRRTTP